MTVATLTPFLAAPAGAAGPRFGPQIADAAFALICSRSAEWRVDPDRIGMIGFSAGAMLTMAVTQNGQAKPAFIGDIYGPPRRHGRPGRRHAPPLFVAIAADDPLIRLDFGLITAWKKANRPVEFHLYEQGGHGFGMYNKTTTSTGWYDAYLRWLDMHGHLKPKG